MFALLTNTTYVIYITWHKKTVQYVTTKLFPALIHNIELIKREQ